MTELEKFTRGVKMAKLAGQKATTMLISDLEKIIAEIEVLKKENEQYQRECGLEGVKHGQQYADIEKDEILRMQDGPVLNAMVAHRVMRWGISHSESHINSNKIYVLALDKSAHYFIEPGKIYDYSRCYTLEIPLYSMDIMSAWEIVQRPTFYSFAVQKCYDGKFYEAYCVIDKNNINIDGKAIAKTAPEAICKAALLAVMEEKNKTDN